MKNKNRLPFVGSILIVMLLGSLSFNLAQSASYWHKLFSSSADFPPSGLLPDSLLGIAYMIIIVFLVIKLPKWWSIAVGLYAFGYDVAIFISWLPQVLYKLPLSVSQLGFQCIIWIYLALVASLLTYGLYLWMSTEKPAKPAKRKK